MRFSTHYSPFNRVSKLKHSGHRYMRPLVKYSEVVAFIFFSEKLFVQK